MDTRDNLSELMARKAKFLAEEPVAPTPVNKQEQMAKQAAQEHIMQFFSYEHLQGPLAAISEPFCKLADAVVNNLPRNPERTVCLRKLLEAKDAAVRAFIAG